MTDLERLCREAYGAYEHLRDNDFSAESGTSKRLRAGNPAKLGLRLAEELQELKGVIEGTHFHEGFDQDIILEGYEVWYWAACLAASRGCTYELIKPHRPLEAGFKAASEQRATLFTTVPNLIEEALAADLEKVKVIKLFEEVMLFIGAACSLNNTSPQILLERDIREMRQKTYLAGYWQSAIIK